ncbi:dihydrokaempferol 4-reductase [Brevirhabdus pacifica]|uniref:Dihydrokaempferol 4-reductase n=1 Tax=Brevirhabdus pacifica TaxID=1267768 RepID=A0A1U7DJQ3_9RHOB|nr:NAD-dependent epimerase/dehydratase family protein [Brevirhabdus pacifica]APX90098.1 dihydrokaempferol 4-reductase [Brevirhabdus pacifica]OWU75313.1 dihydrokaempferol 4-reductase [Loktanella sp. 22II-4b]PJJ82648.1 dihydroflavonol-4-reductase [Brevirhabdus pacifica]
MDQETVLLTGITGYIGKHVALRLLKAGLRVRGSVRDLDRAEEVRRALRPHLRDPDTLPDMLEFVTLDLNRDEGWDEAMAGVDILMHTASPFPLAEPRDAASLIRPAVEGTERALRAAARAGVERVILTSSVAAILSRDLPADREVFTEDDWTDPAHPTAGAYVRSKTEAERAAWRIAGTEAPALRLTAINPGLVLGPPLDRNFGSSVSIVQRLMRGTDPMLPRLGFAAVDVRDVAEMHLRAISRPETEGRRYIAAERFMWFSDLAAAVQEALPDRRIKERVAPDMLVRAMALFDRSLRPVLPTLGRRTDVSNARAVADMDMEFMDARESAAETALFLSATGVG